MAKAFIFLTNFFIYKIHLNSKNVFLFSENNQRHLHLTTAFIRSIQIVYIMHHKKKYSIRLVVIFWIMHFKDIMPAFLHMDKQVCFVIQIYIFNLGIGTVLNLIVFKFEHIFFFE